MRSRLVAVVAAAIPFVPVAADESGDWYFTPQVGGITVDERRITDEDDMLYGLRLGKNFGSVFSLEVGADQTYIRGDGQYGEKNWGYGADLLAVMGRQNTFAPYLLVAAASIRSTASCSPIAPTGCTRAV